MTHHQVVVVVWDDARASATNEVTEDELPHRPTLNKTLGWLLRDDEKGVSIVNEHSLDGDAESWRGHTFVPRAMVRSVTPFNLTTPRKRHEKPAVNPDRPAG